MLIRYQTDEDLDRIIYDDILQEAADTADARYCFIETDIRIVDGPDKSW